MANDRSNMIWMIIGSFYPSIGGAERQVQRVSKILVTQGWPLKVLTRQHLTNFSNNLPAKDVVDDVPVIRLYSRGSSRVGSLAYLLGALWHLSRYGRRGIYHAHGPGAQAWLAVIAQHLLGGQSIIKIRNGNYIYNKTYLSCWWRRWVFAVPLRLATRVVVVSKDGAQLAHKLRISPTRVIRIPNGVDTSLFHAASKEERLSCRECLNLPIDKTVVLYVGRLNLATKDVDTLIRAWAHLPNDVREHAALVIVGDGPDGEELMHMVDSFGLGGSILMVGAKQEIRNYYWAADIFTLPSRDEGLSNALLEAMACGLPVVASRVGGTPDVIEEGKNGFLYEAENCQQLAHKLTLIIEMKDQWDKIGGQGRQTVITHASLNVIVHRLSELYNQLSKEITAD